VGNAVSEKKLYKRENTKMNKTLTMRYALAAFFAAAIFLLGFCAPVRASAYSTATYVVDCCSLVVRDSAGGDAVGYACEGTDFYASKVSGDWLYTESIAGTSGKTISGWIYAPLCASSNGSASTGSTSASSSTAAYTASTGSRVTVTAPVSVTMRKSATAESDAIDWINNGVTLNVLASSNGFYQVSYDGKTGWISSKYAAASGSTSKPVLNASVSTPKPNAGAAASSSEVKGTLNFWAAYNYAEKYCYTSNPAYRYYEDNNCMTYISQILVAGGLPETEEFRDESFPFVRVAEFGPYMKRTYGIDRLEYPSISWIEPGDCVLTNDCGHIMWVTSVENGRVYTCANTNDRWAYNLSVDAIDAVIKTSDLFA